MGKSFIPLQTIVIPNLPTLMSTFCPKDFPTCSKICLPLHPSVFSLGPSNTVKIISQIGGSEVRLHNPKNDTIRLFTMFGGTDDNSSYLPPNSPFPRCYPSRSFHILLARSAPFFQNYGCVRFETSVVLFTFSTFLEVEPLFLSGLPVRRFV